MHVRRHLRAGAKYSDFIPFLLRLRFVVITKFRRIRDRDFGGEGSRCRGWDNIKKEKAKRRGKGLRPCYSSFTLPFQCFWCWCVLGPKLKFWGTAPGHATRISKRKENVLFPSPIPPIKSMILANVPYVRLIPGQSNPDRSLVIFCFNYYFRRYYFPWVRAVY
jgi:hypothetical protein